MVGPKRGLALDAGWADLLSVTAFGANHFSDGESVQGMVFCFVVTESASVQLLAAGALQKKQSGKSRLSDGGRLHMTLLLLLKSVQSRKKCNVVRIGFIHWEEASRKVYY